MEGAPEIMLTMEALLRRFQAVPPLLLITGIILVALLTFTLLLLMVISFKRRQTKRLLEDCGLPTVLWRPRFVHYNLNDGSSNIPQKLPSSNITGILPRMERLGGPFGMYGTVYGVSTPVVHVAHPTPARSILMGASDLSKHARMSLSQTPGATKAPAYNHFKNFSGDGVFTADGEAWKEKRASVIHCLLKGISNSSSDASKRLEEEANIAANTAIAELEQSHVKKGHVDNIVPILQKATIGLIYRYITHDCDGEGHDREDTVTPGMSSASSSSSSLSSMASPPDSSSVRKPTEICPHSLLQTYLTSVSDIRMIILAQSRSIWFLLPRRVYQLCSTMYQDEERTMGPIRTFARRACSRAQPGSPLALLQERPSHCRDSIIIDGLSKSMLDEAITLLFAGQDTSAATLSWTLHLLSLHIDVQARLVDEARSILEDHTEEVEYDGNIPRFTKKLVSKMQLLDAVIKESMRLYPVAPFVVRRLTHCVTVEDASQRTDLPTGSFACIWIYGLHRNNQFWHRPDDFVPERWIDPALRAKDAGQRMQGCYMPFAAGPRNCVGQPLAHVILRIVLARLVYQYEFRDERLDPGRQQGEADKTTARLLRKDMQSGFTVLPSGGLALSVHKRKQS